MNKMIRSLFCAVSFAFGAQTMHAGVSFADMQANAKKATRVDHAITILSAIGMIKGLNNYDWIQASVWGKVAFSSVMGTVLNSKEGKEIARFQAGGALVANRMFSEKRQYSYWENAALPGQEATKKKATLRVSEPRAEFYGLFAGAALYFIDILVFKKK